MAVNAASYIANQAITPIKNQVNTDVTRFNNNVKTDSKNVKSAATNAAYNAFLDIKKAISESVSDTETVALGKCLNRCKTDAKDMISSHDSFKSSSPNIYRGSGSNKRRSNKRRSNKRRSNKRRSNKRRSNKRRSKKYTF
jgi:hypothetical protein